MILDAHSHAWPRWPYRADVPDPATRGSVETLLHHMDASGVDEALIVAADIGPRGARADDNAYVAAAAARHPDRLHVAVDVDSRWSPEYHTPGIAARLAEAVGRTQAEAVAHYLAAEDDGWFATDEADALLDSAARFGVPLSLHAPPTWFAGLGPWLARARVPVLLHHQGLVRPSSPTFDADVEALRSLASHPAAYVKLSGPHYLVREPWNFPYAEARPVLDTLMATFGPDRLAWGSDFPVAAPHLTYRQSLEWVRSHAGISGAELDAVLGGTLARVLAR